MRDMNFLNREILSLHAAALILGGAALMSKLLGLLRDRLLASRFGAGDALDVYYAAFQIPDLLFTLFFDFPEVNHVLVEATQKPSSALQKKYLFFESNFNNERVMLRYKITKDIFKEQGLETNSYTLKSKTILGQSLELAHYCAWIGFYISILDDTDPGPEPWIIKLKSALS